MKRSTIALLPDQAAKSYTLVRNVIKMVVTLNYMVMAFFVARNVAKRPVDLASILLEAARQGPHVTTIKTRSLSASIVSISQ